MQDSPLLPVLNWQLGCQTSTIRILKIRSISCLLLAIGYSSLFLIEESFRLNLKIELIFLLKSGAKLLVPSPLDLSEYLRV